VETIWQERLSDSVIKVTSGMRVRSIGFSTTLCTYLRTPRNLHLFLSTKRYSHSDMSVVNKSVHPFDKSRLDALLNRRFFYAPAFEIYGGMQHVIILIYNNDTDNLHSQVLLASMTMVHQGHHCKPISWQNGESISSSRITCWNSIPPL
jgi:hypothetical protein